VVPRSHFALCPNDARSAGAFFVPQTGRKGAENMKIYEELKARGLIAQVSSEEAVSELVNSGKAVFYICA
jgi:tyrosyl-tRNA synthetase